MGNGVRLSIVTQNGRVSNGPTSFIIRPLKSSRPREPPPQPLTDTDVNLSVHPAPIDQPIVALIANVRTDTNSFSQCAQANKRLCAYVDATFCISAWPIFAMNR